MARLYIVMMTALHLTAAAPAAADIDPSHWKCKPGDVTVETMRGVNGREVEVLTRGPGCPDAEPVLGSRVQAAGVASTAPAEEAGPSIVADGLHAHARAASATGAVGPVGATSPIRAWLILVPLLALGMMAGSAAVCYDRKVRRPRMAALEADRRRKEAEEQAEALRLAEEGRSREADEQEERRRILLEAAEREEAERALREVREAAEREAAREQEEATRQEAEDQRQRAAAEARAGEEAARLDRERRAAEEEAETRRRAQEEAEAKAKKRCGPCGGCGSKPRAGQPDPAAPPSGHSPR